MIWGPNRPDDVGISAPSLRGSTENEAAETIAAAGDNRRSSRRTFSPLHFPLTHRSRRQPSSPNRGCATYLSLCSCGRNTHYGYWRWRCLHGATGGMERPHEQGRGSRDQQKLSLEVGATAHHAQPARQHHAGEHRDGGKREGAHRSLAREERERASAGRPTTDGGASAAQDVPLELPEADGGRWLV